MSKRFGFFTLILIVFSLILVACNGENKNSGNEKNNGEKEFTIRIGSGHTTEGASWTEQTSKFFIPEVDKRLEGTGYKINWIESYGGSIATLGENLDAVEAKILDMSVLVVPFKPSELLISNIGYNTVFGSPDPLQMSQVMMDLYDLYPEFQEEYTKRGQKALSFGVSDSYELITSFPVNGIEDLKGRKIGGAGSNLVWLESVGAIPVQGGLGETYQNIQSGVYDGYIMYPRGTYGYRLHEVAPYITEVGFGSILVGVLTINNNTYDGLPEEVQKIIDEVGVELTNQIAEATVEETPKNIKLMEDEGAIFTKLSDQERAKWAEMLPNQPNDYAQRMNNAGLPGSEILRDYLRLIEEHGYKFPREYIIE